MRWSVVIPYYNEEEFLPRTLASLAAQTLQPFRFILVDNGSTDASRAVAEAFAHNHRAIETMLLDETRPGQIHALETGLAAANTEFVATCDADTVYPPHYLAQAEKLLEENGPGTVAAVALGIYSKPESPSGRWKRVRGMVAATLLPRQLHVGGFSHAFRNSALKAAGGYSKALWPYVLYDHELMHRIMKQGRVRYAYGHWCIASDRRGDSTAVRWTLGERLLYHVTPFALKDWLFYKFLARRFEARRLSHLNLRSQSWQGEIPKS